SGLLFRGRGRHGLTDVAEPDETDARPGGGHGYGFWLRTVGDRRRAASVRGPIRLADSDQTGVWRSGGSVGWSDAFHGDSAAAPAPGAECLAGGARGAVVLEGIRLKFSRPVKSL